MEQKHLWKAIICKVSFFKALQSFYFAKVISRNFCGKRENVVEFTTVIWRKNQNEFTKIQIFAIFIGLTRKWNPNYVLIWRKIHLFEFEVWFSQHLLDKPQLIEQLHRHNQPKKSPNSLVSQKLEPRMAKKCGNFRIFLSLRFYVK